MKTLFLFLITTTLIGFSACEMPDAGGDDMASEVNIDSVKMQLQSLEDAYAKASNAQDAEGLVAYYADDAHSLPPNEPTLKGKAAILEHTKKEMAGDTIGITMSFEVVDVFAEGDLAVEVGKYTGTNKDGEKFTGKYMSLFEKRDGKYVCIRDIWNSDSPPPDDDEDEEDDDNDGDD